MNKNSIIYLIKEEHNHIIFENDYDHQKQLAKTGFWGKAGAGAIILALSTKKILLPLRSGDVEQPYTYGTWGGAIDSNETPEQATRREIKEEVGYYGNYNLIPLYIYKHKSGFKYYNYLAIVNDEFVPELNWETDDYGWFNINELPDNLHFGLKALLNDKNSYNKILKYINN